MGNWHIFIVDNARQLKIREDDYTHLVYNKNTGGSGGFQRGIEEIRKQEGFTHVIFMDDDVAFDINSFYLLFVFSFRWMKKTGTVQWQDVCFAWTDQIFNIQRRRSGMVEIFHMWNFCVMCAKAVMHRGKLYMTRMQITAGWWFCCFPIEFVLHNDVLPFFIHCDDVEYGLRCGRKPIIIEGVQVWHETYDKRMTPLMQYYDTRNPLFVNQIHGFLPGDRAGDGSMETKDYGVSCAEGLAHRILCDSGYE